MKIWEYDLKPGTNTLTMPAGAHLLTVQMQDDTPRLWARVSMLTEDAHRIVRIVGTGQDAPELPYIATFQMGWMAWHAFDGGEFPLHR